MTPMGKLFIGLVKRNGHMTWYATKLKNYILIEATTKGKIIVTPDDTGMEVELVKLIPGRPGLTAQVADKCQIVNRACSDLW
jgi:hypothetical protein